MSEDNQDQSSQEVGHRPPTQRGRRQAAPPGRSVFAIILVIGGACVVVLAGFMALEVLWPLAIIALGGRYYGAVSFGGPRFHLERAGLVGLSGLSVMGVGLILKELRSTRQDRWITAHQQQPGSDG